MEQNKFDLKIVTETLTPLVFNCTIDRMDQIKCKLLIVKIHKIKVFLLLCKKKNHYWENCYCRIIAIFIHIEKAIAAKEHKSVLELTSLYCIQESTMSKRMLTLASIMNLINEVHYVDS